MLISTCPWGQNPNGDWCAWALNPLPPALLGFLIWSLTASWISEEINKLSVRYARLLAEAGIALLLHVGQGELLLFSSFLRPGKNCWKQLCPLSSDTPRIFPALSRPLGSQSHSHALSPQQNCNLKVRIPEHDNFNGSEAFLLPPWPSRERTPDIYLLFQHYVGRLQTIK